MSLPFSDLEIICIYITEGMFGLHKNEGNEHEYHDQIQPYVALMFGLLSTACINWNKYLLSFNVGLFLVMKPLMALDILMCTNLFLFH